MRFIRKQTKPPGNVEGGFSLVEAIIGMCIASVMFIALYAGLLWGFSTLRLARDNLRATQIILEKMETIRLYTWEQITVKTNFLPAQFTASYYPPGLTNASGSGTLYSGTLTITPVAFGSNYDDDMAVVTVNVEWTTGQIPRRRTLSTYVSQYGLQNYIW
jgi:type II secretory pathway pseudopilin PulG